MYKNQRVLIAAVILALLASVATTQAESIPFTNNLVLWLSADAGVSQSGGKVTAWNDQATVVGGSNDAVQGDAARQPVLVANGSPMGDRPVIRFDGSDDRFDIAANDAFTTNTLSWFAVYTAGESTATLRVIEAGDSVGNSYLWGTTIYPSSGGVRQHGVYCRNSGLSYKVLLSDNVPISDFVMSSAVLNGTSTEINGNLGEHFYAFLNGTQVSGSPRGDTDMVSTGNLGLRVGARFGSDGKFLNGDIAEIIVYNTALSTSDREAVDQYLIQKPPPENLWVNYGFEGRFPLFSRRFQWFDWRQNLDIRSLGCQKA